MELIKEEENEKEIEKFEKKLKQKEIEVFLSGKYDKGNAILSIYAGAGGQDAQDWATLLLRMYERHCAFKGFKTEVLHQAFGEGGGPEGRIGTKSATMEIKGQFAYGFLKNETGVHRLVRISPFSAQKLRHTSFALVEVLPAIETSEEVSIDEKDLKIEFYRASGPGGQYVNKRETSVRITHLPTGITVSCQLERTQGANRKKAMELLYSKLYQFQKENQQKTLEKIKGKKISASWGNHFFFSNFSQNYSFADGHYCCLPVRRIQGANRKKAMELLYSKLYQFQKENQQKTLEKIKGKKISASWGNQIRSYVFHPYKLVKDLRTQVETANVEEVLNGNLEEFIFEAETKYTTMIKFQNIAKIYPPDTVALEEISFEIQPKEFVSIVGKSGGGKTTLLRLLLAEEKPTKGRVFFDDVDVHRIKKSYYPLFTPKNRGNFSGLQIIAHKNGF